MTGEMKDRSCWASSQKEDGIYPREDGICPREDGILPKGGSLIGTYREYTESTQRRGRPGSFQGPLPNLPLKVVDPAALRGREESDGDFPP